MQSHELRGRFSHSIDIEIIFDPPDVLLCECGTPARHVIDVASRAHIVTCMEAVTHLFGMKHVDISRERIVDTASERLSSARDIDIEMRHLRQRVNARIGPPRAVQLEVGNRGRFPDGAGVARPIDAGALRIEQPLKKLAHGSTTRRKER